MAPHADNYTRSLYDEMKAKSQQLRAARDAYRAQKAKEKEGKVAKQAVKGSVRRTFSMATRYIADKRPDLIESAAGLLEDLVKNATIVKDAAAEYATYVVKRTADRTARAAAAATKKAAKPAKPAKPAKK